jgi:hypothetical protein
MSKKQFQIHIPPLLCVDDVTDILLRVFFPVPTPRLSKPPARSSTDTDVVAPDQRATAVSHVGVPAIELMMK